jgi:hypothetical protein
VITADFADRFAREWIDAWNAHDVDRVLKHYSDDFVLSSPYIVSIAGVESGYLAGKEAVRAYWLEALRRMPALRFHLLGCCIGVRTLVIHYRGVAGLAAECFTFERGGLVIRADAHYQ